MNADSYFMWLAIHHFMKVGDMVLSHSERRCDMNVDRPQLVATIGTLGKARGKVPARRMTGWLGIEQRF